jgi:hypothetical protein
MATAALSNDSTAETGAGGLVLQRTDAIDMVSEDLFISADRVRVRYLFRNRTAADVETLVAFPMPGRDLAAVDEGDVAFPSEFRTSVGGRPVTAQLERKAVFKGKDQTALLNRLRVPIASDAKLGTEPIVRALDRLSAESKARLHAMGLVRGEPYSEKGKVVGVHLLPQWTVQDAWFWRQRFSAGRDLPIEHSYRPGAGGSVDTLFAYPDLRQRPEGLRAAERFCIDAAFLAGVDRLRARSPGGLPERRVSYVLSTAANWRSPIADFRMVVDKGQPGNIVSFCGGGVKKLNSTQFELKYRNFRPMRDFHVLIIEPRS